MFFPDDEKSEDEADYYADAVQEQPSGEIFEHISIRKSKFKFYFHILGQWLDNIFGIQEVIWVWKLNLSYH